MHSHTVQGVNLDSMEMETTAESENYHFGQANGDHNDEEKYRPLAEARSEFVCGDRRRSNDRGREEQSKVRDP